ncbi:MAG: hypothetical protein HKN33_05245 [Pyrinomonadaceae bacterium]|nr:hypothetical protein [Pyrinomonadaceae bacterium]
MNKSIRKSSIIRGFLCLFMLTACMVSAGAISAQAQMTRQQLETEFRNTPEAQRRGTPSVRDFVVSLYWRYLGTAPDTNLQLHINRVANGQISRLQLENEFAKFGARTSGPPTDVDWVVSLYWRYFGRQPDSFLQSHVNKLSSIGPPVPASGDAQFLTRWANDERKKLPLTLGQVELTTVTTFCPNGCQRSRSGDKFLLLEGWTQNLMGRQSDSAARAIKPALVPIYCASGAPQKGINLNVNIWDMNKINNPSLARGTTFAIDASACPSTGGPSGGGTPDDRFWNRIANSTNVQDFRSYLATFGQNGKHASKANQKIAQLTAPVLTPDDRFWNRIANSTNVQDFRSYLATFGQNGKHASKANQKIAQLTTPVSPDDRFWNRIVNSTNVQDFQSYLATFGQNGKHAAQANQKIAQLTAPVLTPEDRAWNQIANSTNAQDFQGYLATFGQNGKYAPIARLKLMRLQRAANSPDDRFWNRIANSTDVQDFRSYLATFGQNGKHAVQANQAIARLTTGGGAVTAEDRFWNSISNSSNPQDFQTYLTNFGQNGKYASLARLNIRRLANQKSPDDLAWDRIKNSQNAFDFQGYLNNFPNGKHVVEARQKKNRIEQRIALDNFLRNAEFGSLTEISAFRKVFITASDLNSQNRIVSDLNKKLPSLIIVGNQQSADFFIEYKLVKTPVANCNPGTNPAVNACELHTGTMWVHTKKLRGTGNEFNRILWKKVKSKQYSDAGVNLFTKNPAATTTGDLIKDLKRLGF